MGTGTRGVDRLDRDLVGSVGAHGADRLDHRRAGTRGSVDSIVDQLTGPGDESIGSSPRVMITLSKITDQNVRYFMILVNHSDQNILTIITGCHYRSNDT
jgi:hypothetical protein